MLLLTCTAYKNRCALKTLGKEDLGLDISVDSVSDVCKYLSTPWSRFRVKKQL